MIDASKTPSSYVSNLGCFLWIACTVVTVAAIILAMKYSMQWSSEMFADW